MDTPIPSPRPSPAYYRTRMLRRLREGLLVRRLRGWSVAVLVALCLFTPACDPGHLDTIAVQLHEPALRVSASAPSMASRDAMVDVVAGVCAQFGLAAGPADRDAQKEGLVRMWSKQVHREPESRMHETTLFVTIRTAGASRYDVVVGEFVTPTATPESSRLYNHVYSALSRTPGVTIVQSPALYRLER